MKRIEFDICTGSVLRAVSGQSDTKCIIIRYARADRAFYVKKSPTFIEPTCHCGYCTVGSYASLSVCPSVTG